VRLLEGKYAGIPMQIDYGRRQARPAGFELKPGDRVMVTISKSPDGVVSAYFADYVRLPALGWMAAAFALAIVATGRWKGLRSLLGLFFSLLVIIAYVIPHILAGEDPVRVSIIGSAILLAATLYLTYGWTLKTHASVFSMLIVLLLTGALAWVAIDVAHITGVGDENAMFLMQIPQVSINLRGLVLGGMIIGALGVLDDLVTTQSAAVFELHAANPDLGFGPLFRAAMRIGQDHVAATVNTLVLAYAGASLPMLLLFALGNGRPLVLVNAEFVAQEIVRTLVGSLGLIAAVPVTTAIAAGLALHRHRLGSLAPLLGPANSGGGHIH
jgi:uncharacterized membrane protein